MLNLYDRTFQKMGEIPTNKKEEINKTLNPETAAAFDMQEQERVRAQKVEEFLNNKINNEIERATTKEEEIEKIISYNFHPVEFGGTWDDESWCDSITIYKGAEEQTRIAIPPFPGNYGHHDVFNIPFILNNYIYFICLESTPLDPIIRPTGIYQPYFDNTEYKIAISTKKLPWIQ